MKLLDAGECVQKSQEIVPGIGQQFLPYFQQRASPTVTPNAWPELIVTALSFYISGPVTNMLLQEMQITKAATQ